MKNSQKGSVVIVLLAIIVLVLGGAGFYLYNERGIKTKKNEVRNVVSDAKDITSEKLTCVDSDNGDDYFTQGAVNYSEPINILDNRIAEVNSVTDAILKLGTSTLKVKEGETYAYSEYDQVYYQDKNNQTSSVMTYIPGAITVKEINFVKPGDSNNGIKIVKKYAATDQCVGDVLIENSCVRGINTGYLCPKGCSQGACIK